MPADSQSFLNQLSKLACPCCQKQGMQNDVLVMFKKLFYMMNGDLQVNSGYRCPLHNAAAGGAPKSFHLLGRAIDFGCRNLEYQEQLADLAHSIGFTGFGYAGTYIHCDTGPARSWRYDSQNRPVQYTVEKIVH
jgi:uncharacterized protein YcbK (DUF882 family)